MKLFFILLRGCLCLLQSISFVHAQPLVLNDATGAPYTTADQNGFLDIVGSKIFKSAGVDLVLVNLPAERGLRNANEGTGDGDIARIKGLDKIYTNLVRVPEKIMDMHFVAFSKNYNLRFDGWQGLRDYNIGYIRGWKILEDQTQDFPHVQAVRNTDVLFSMLAKDRIDVALFSHWVGMVILKNKDMSGIYVLEPPLATREMYIYLHKKHSDLVPKITASLREMKNSGEYDRLFKEKVINAVN